MYASLTLQGNTLTPIPGTRKTVRKQSIGILTGTKSTLNDFKSWYSFLITKCKELVKVVQFMATMSLHGIGTCIPGTSMSIAMARVVKSRVRRTSVKLPGWAKTLSNSAFATSLPNQQLLKHFHITNYVEKPKICRGIKKRNCFYV
jgi:hypothetical protein